MRFATRRNVVIEPGKWPLARDKPGSDDDGPLLTLFVPVRRTGSEKTRQLVELDDRAHSLDGTRIGTGRFLFLPWRKQVVTRLRHIC